MPQTDFAAEILETEIVLTHIGARWLPAGHLGRYHHAARQAHADPAGGLAEFERAMAPREAGGALVDIARSYNVSPQHHQ
jgi:hypothetical protein